MASFLGVCIVLLAASASIRATSASHAFKVGDEIGWSEPSSNGTDVYNHWASKIRFRVGDSLYFEYKNDSVLTVDKKGYYHCVTSNPISSSSDGNTTIKLDRPGPFYFISGASDHCRKGQRLIVDVLGPHPSPHLPHHPDSVKYAPSPSPLSSFAVSTTASSQTILLALSTLVLLLFGSPLLQ